MRANTVDDALSSLSVLKEVELAAPIHIAWAAVLEELGPGGEMPGGAPFPMVLEAWPGGRWLRDLGNNAGHLWGHVQVIKPPTVLEISGPLFMSYPALSHLQYRLTDHGDRTHLKLTHRVVGQITTEHREGVTMGWEHRLGRVCEIAARMKIDEAPRLEVRGERSEVRSEVGVGRRTHRCDRSFALVAADLPTVPPP
jgi:hypothetical protein